MNNTRVVITGTGMISSVGNSVAESWDSLINGKSGIGPITNFNAEGFRTQIAGEVKNLDMLQYMDRKEVRRQDPFCQYAIAASEEAVQQANLDFESLNLERIGVLIGSGIGGIRALDTASRKLEGRGPGKVSPFTVPMMIGDMASGVLSIRYGLKGPNIGIVSACASATHAIGEAFWMIKRGDADIMVTGGAEAAADALGVASFCAMKAMSERNDDPQHASRPFDKERDGFVMSEGAGIIILETLESAQARGAEIIAEIAGYGLTGDAGHITAPDPQGRGAAAAIRMALGHAEMNPEDISYINAHGTSTPLNDKYETLAIKAALGDYAYKLPISSTKSMTGHGLGAAGGFETLICSKVIQTGIVPPTINYENPDPDCDLDYVPNTAREVKINTALNINLGFGGHNGVLILKRFK
ncbi:MAG: beta-ketoacyl-ACP synthase II [Verrucomicrobiota bacterium]|nr:beta-ketoacyl-ACP synthase II [Verrucomicrobiota bacterium]